MKADIGLIGLAVMGENLVMNMESKGFTVAVFNRDTKKVDAFVEGRGKGKNIIGTRSLEELVAALKPPRRVMLMIKAGSPVDQMIDNLIPLLTPGDIVIDGGNSHFPDTERRAGRLEESGMLYVGTGVSGGEEGALLGPAIMPGGSDGAWAPLEPIFTAISAKAGDANDPCCAWIGPGGAGHFVKMVHNGIEYGDMQLICEAYAVMRDVLGMGPDEIHSVFDEWNRGPLCSYLIEITRDIFTAKDGDGYVVDTILDTAGQKGTGKWTSQAALDEGIPLTLISEAVFARALSAVKEERTAASTVLGAGTLEAAIDKGRVLKDLHDALYCSKIMSYAQGYSLMAAYSAEKGWNLDMGAIAMIWRGGCIIRSVFLGRIMEAYRRDPALSNLLLDPFFKDAVGERLGAWRRAVVFGVSTGVSMPAMASALAYYDGYRQARLPANLLQAQRDYFGAHQYERTDRPRGEFFHFNWTGRGGSTASTMYNV